MTGFNGVDGALLAWVALQAWGATRRGFLQVALGLLGFVLTLGIALIGAGAAAAWLATHTGLPQLWTPPLGFLAVWLTAQVGYTGITHVLLQHTHYRATRSSLNRWLALLPGAGQGLLVGALLLTVLALVPLPGLPHDAILNSAIGGRLVAATVAVQRPLDGIFGPALRQTLGFLTVKPEAAGGETVTLNFQVPQPSTDAEAEEAMLSLVNAERSKAGLPTLAMDAPLRDLARSHAADLFRQGYFSHTGRDGRSPFDRMHDAGIRYSTAGENLALAISTAAAHDGLMHSPGHRANILNPTFRRVGIGALDGSPYGKMFVQEFTD
ncbi:MAG: CAP domain-containing protein [Chloroflexota bacterium]|nr:CAP domain-containing protein [Chloroflexota bacterium]